MANVSGMDLQEKLTGKTQQEPMSVKTLLQKDIYKKRFEEILGQKAAGFVSSILNVTNMNDALQKVNPHTVITAAAVAATLDLPIDKNLGFAHIVPYGKDAQFQVGWKGYVQLGLRTGQYKSMSVSEVYEDELEYYNPITEEIRFTDMDKWTQRDNDETDKVVGYYAYFELINGFRKGMFMSKKKIEAHGKKYSKSFHLPNSQWKQNFHAMAMKTVIKLLLSKWGILSIEMQKAMQADQGVITNVDNLEEVKYTDNGDYVEADFSVVE